MRYNQAMTPPDFNLLLTLDALLAEGSVARAARRLRLSPSAMSRALARLREATGDPLLVRAGRGLVATPRAQALREQVGQLVQEVESVLRPAQTLKLAQLSRTFTLRTREGFIENFGAELIARASAQAPGVQLCFVQKTDKQSHALREGSADLEIGVVGKVTSPEVRSRALFRDRFVGVVRLGHPLLDAQEESAGAADLTPARYAGGRHISVSRQGLPKGPIDDTLAALGLERHIATIVASFASALALARASDLIASVPDRQTGLLRAGLHSFALPFPAPEITVSLLWHPRFDADPAHRWLRTLVLDICGEAYI
jgi:DNA-binding transcriptional LysR family regulator